METWGGAQLCVQWELRKSKAGDVTGSCVSCKTSVRSSRGKRPPGSTQKDRTAVLSCSWEEILAALQLGGPRGGNLESPGKMRSFVGLYLRCREFPLHPESFFFFFALYFNYIH